MENTNWQIRVNVYDNQDNAYKIIEAINKLELGYDIRILNIDKGDSESDDELQGCCKGCGCLDSSLHSNTCERCLDLEKKQAQENEKYSDETYMVEWGHVAYCSQCNTPAKYAGDDAYWYCPEPGCSNCLPLKDVNCCGSTEFYAINITKDKLKEIKKEFEWAEWI